MKYRKFFKNLQFLRYTEIKTVPLPRYRQHGLYALQPVRMTAAQIEAGRLALIRTAGKKEAQVVVRVFPHIPVTKKALGTRMGGGKGAVDHFVAFVRAGTMLYEFNSKDFGKQTQRAVQFKLPIKIKLSTNGNFVPTPPRVRLPQAQ